MKKLIASLVVLGLFFTMAGNLLAATTEEHSAYGPDQETAYRWARMIGDDMMRADGHTNWAVIAERYIEIPESDSWQCILTYEIYD